MLHSPEEPLDGKLSDIRGIMPVEGDVKAECRGQSTRITPLGGPAQANIVAIPVQKCLIFPVRKYSLAYYCRVPYTSRQRNGSRSSAWLAQSI